MQTLTLVELERVFRAAWGRDTCDDHDLADWTPDNPARGQCGVTALVLAELIGGQLMLGEVHVDGTRTGMHWWNLLGGGVEVDLTREQFRPEEIVTAGRRVAVPQERPRRCLRQYLTLRGRVRHTLGLDLGPADVPGDRWQPAEAALLLAESYPDIVRGAVLYAPNDTVWSGYPYGNAWTIGGDPVPRTAIPVTHVAGHGVGSFPYLAAGTVQTSQGTDVARSLGGTRGADAAARSDSWPEVLAFLAA